MNTIFATLSLLATITAANPALNQFERQTLLGMRTFAITIAEAALETTSSGLSTARLATTKA